MKLFEMGAKLVCPKCGQGPMSKTHYWYKGGWQCKAGPSTTPPPVASPPVASPPVASPPSQVTPTAVSQPRPVVHHTPPGAASVQNAPGGPPSAASQRKMLEQFLQRTLQITDFNIAPDLSVSVVGDVKVSMSPFKKVPLKFTNISGSFSWLAGELVSMENMPSHVGGDFNISNNNITSLDGMPTVVGDINLSGNEIASWVGLPDSVGGDLDIFLNPAIDLVENLPTHVLGNLSLGSTQPYSLRGIHKKVRVAGDVVVSGQLIEGGLGLMMVKGLESVIVSAGNGKSAMPSDAKKALDIIEKAIDEDADVLDTQEKLIDAGFSKFAKL